MGTDKNQECKFVLVRKKDTFFPRESEKKEIGRTRYKEVFKLERRVRGG